MAGQQQEEIETIRSRTIEVKLSDADVKRISEKAAAHGLTVGELIENFIGDLVCGTYSNGSDERMYAEQWFERCWFGMFPDLTFLSPAIAGLCLQSERRGFPSFFLPRYCFLRTTLIIVATTGNGEATIR